MARPLLSRATLWVVVNPFAAPLDEQGRPCTIVQFDPDHTPAGTVRRIGCSLDRKPLADHRPRRPGSHASPAQYPRFDTSVVYDLAAKPVPHSVYHVALLKSGDLVPANETTAKICGMKFVDPGVQVEAALEKAVAEWLFDHEGQPIDPAAWVEAGQITEWPSAKPRDAQIARDTTKMADDERRAAEEERVELAKKATLAHLEKAVKAGEAAAAKLLAAKEKRLENSKPRSVEMVPGGEA